MRPAWIPISAVLLCGCASDPPPPLPAPGPSVDPFGSLPPLTEPLPGQEFRFTPGPAAPSRVDRTLAPLRLQIPSAVATGTPRSLPLILLPRRGDPWQAVVVVLPRPATTPDGLRFAWRPPVSGRLRRLGPHTAVFLPQHRFRFATRYTLKLSGADLPVREITRVFDTARPRLVKSTPRPDARGIDHRPRFTLTFDQPVDPQSVRRKTRR